MKFETAKWLIAIPVALWLVAVAIAIATGHSEDASFGRWVVSTGIIVCMWFILMAALAE